MAPSGSGDPAGVAVLAVILLAVLAASALLLWLGLWRARRAVPALVVDEERER